MFWLRCVLALINIIAAFAVDLLECYSPVQIAYSVKEPSGGLNANLNPILFLHAIYYSKEYWFEIPQAVADRTNRKVYALNARDHGDSEQTDCFNFDVNARDVLQFMDDRNIRKAVLVGHSMGAVAAIKVALNYPERVEKVVIEDFFVKNVSLEALQTVSKLILLIEDTANKVPNFYDFNTANKYVTDYINENSLTQLALGSSTVPVNTTRYFAIEPSASGWYTMKMNIPAVLRSLRSVETTVSDNIGVFNGPALFIYGTESPFNVFQDAKTILNHFPNVQFFPVLGSNHEVHNNFPREYTENISKFILKQV